MIGLSQHASRIRADISGNRRTRFPGPRAGGGLEAFENQEIPLGPVIIQALRPRVMMASRSPLVQVLLVIQNNPLTGRTARLALTPSILDPGTGTSKFDLALGVRGHARRLRRVRWSSTQTCEIAKRIERF